MREMNFGIFEGLTFSQAAESIRKFMINGLRIRSGLAFPGRNHSLISERVFIRYLKKLFQIMPGKPLP